MSASANFGLLDGNAHQMLSVFVQCELDDGAGLALALSWLRRGLYLTEVQEEGLKIALKRQLAGIPAVVRSGQAICDELVHDLSFLPDRSNISAVAALQQQPFLTGLAAKLETPEGAAEAVAAVRGVRAALLAPARVHALVAGNVLAMPDPVRRFPYHQISYVSAPVSSRRYSENVFTISRLHPRIPSGSVFLFFLPTANFPFRH